MFYQRRMKPIILSLLKRLYKECSYVSILALLVEGKILIKSNWKWNSKEHRSLFGFKNQRRKTSKINTQAFFLKVFVATVWMAIMVKWEKNQDSILVSEKHKLLYLVNSFVKLYIILKIIICFLNLWCHVVWLLDSVHPQYYPHYF